jgi:hypothetical protein
MHGVPPGVTNPPAPVPPDAEHAGKSVPGTLVLVFVFLAAFVVYYFVNWKLLSFIWKIG